MPKTVGYAVAATIAWLVRSVDGLAISASRGAEAPLPASNDRSGNELPLAGPMVTTAAPHSIGSDKPMLFFLFMLYDKINHEELWNRFFTPAVQSVDYRALVHCKSESSCRQNIKSMHRFEIIPSVPTTYCTDLVAGMNALLKAALAMRGTAASDRDKFIFLSDSTVPVKRFAVMQHRLVMDEPHASDFCIFPRNEWAEVTSVTGGSGERVTQVAVKHHQWIILSRRHAVQAVEHANEHMDLMQRFQLNVFTASNSWRNTGCLDEFWHFAALFGSLRFQDEPQSIFLQDFTGEPLATNNYEIQGECSTFVHWPPRASGLVNNMTSLAQELASDPGTTVTPPSDQRPAVIRRLSKTSLMAMRNSWFLFARKVDSSAEFAGCGSLAEAFDGLVFAETPRPPASQEATWPGQGSWLDNRRSQVSIITNDGSLALKGVAPDMDATGSYCGDSMKVTFSTGYSASATLARDGQHLVWSNGVTWVRAGVAA
mmetsp:Transcript_69674/g.130006  ORF Transcript_69674/g.130006 Transcript_69674/m.130006 type:complete len:485 (-) Transcript_69674:88-1542(-)